VETRKFGPQLVKELNSSRATTPNLIEFPAMTFFLRGAVGLKDEVRGLAAPGSISTEKGDLIIAAAVA
jgi:hypothetical protein